MFCVSSHTGSPCERAVLVPFPHIHDENAPVLVQSQAKWFCEASDGALPVDKAGLPVAGQCAYVASNVYKLDAVVVAVSNSVITSFSQYNARWVFSAAITFRKKIILHSSKHIIAQAVIV
jgi:hypothetical protein